MDALQELLGAPPDLTVAQMSLRALIVFTVTLIYVRLANKRFLGRYTAFDAVLAIILGSVMSRAINGQAPFGRTLVAGAVLLGLHWVVGALALRSPTFSRLVKGRPRLLVRDGRMVADALRGAHITPEDLLEDIRYEAHVGSLAEIETAYLECNGKIGIVPRRRGRE